MICFAVIDDWEFIKLYRTKRAAVRLSDKLNKVMDCKNHTVMTIRIGPAS